LKILVTGAGGFIGRNLIEKLTENCEVEILRYEKNTDPGLIHNYTSSCDFVFHFAAVHRPLDESEFERVNLLFFAGLLEKLRASANSCPVLLTSSIQAVEDTRYGRSKLAAEEELKKHAALLNAQAIIYRLTNTFGRYAKPNHHSVVATFCYNIAHGLPIRISDPNHVMKLYYIDDVTDSFISRLRGDGEPDADGYYRLPEKLKYEITLKALADKIYCFKNSVDQGCIPDVSDEFTGKLYETYLSYNP
jgi:UDP-2-acetamido-2,6-beta-L-arabino-hexul-4-ose reductase